MNKVWFFFLVFTLLLSACTPAQVNIPVETGSPVIVAENTVEPTHPLETSPAATLPSVDIDEIIEYEMKGSFDYFWEQANTDMDSPGYGLIRDRYPGSEGIASIAAVGFGLTAYLVGIEKGYITREAGLERVNHTLNTLLALDRVEGFYYHFLDMKTGKRAWNSEVSSIDTAILMMGVLSAGEYFAGEIETKAQELYEEVNWTWFLDESRNMFYMAYRPEKGFEGHWDFYAEQLMLYVLAAGSDTHPIDSLPYYTFTRHKAKYGTGQPFIHSWFGSIFTHQFSHAWIDFRGRTDKKEVNWFENSVEASLAQVNFAAAMDEKYLTLGPNAWGLTACDGPDGYNGLYGAPPSGFDNKAHLVDDTVPPAGAIGSIVFVPEAAERAMAYYYSLDQLNGKYGFLDAFNLSRDWYANDWIGIDKGITLLMLANYQDNIVYKITMENKSILQGLNLLEIIETR
ncbi:MAG TPA: glucoamylase family protein [Anaerolineaceae bacterium]|nr:glucoamylase family protein [Anaerolineaceae bacterium]HOH20471.1 glucoamylase family protein [Anaerolineaceae bacterium]HQO97591.1 glucoamylase family protein [Anaerolineaceae bacterium]